MSIRFRLITYCCLFFLMSCHNLKRKIVITILPIKYSFHEIDTIIIEDYKNQNINVQYDASHFAGNRKLSYYYFHLIKDSLYYFGDLFFIQNELNGVGVEIQNNASNKKYFKEYINGQLMPSFFNSVTNEKGLFAIDTTWQSDDFFKISIKTKELQDKIASWERWGW